MVGIRFGETIKAYVQKFGDASRLTAIPLGIAGWLRYMLGVDDEGNKLDEPTRYLAVLSVLMGNQGICAYEESVKTNSFQ